MEETKLRKFQKQLEDERRKIEDDLSHIAKKDGSVKNDYDAVYEDFGDDEEDNAQEYVNMEAKVSEEQVLEVKVLEIKKALERIKSGTYGKCVKCGVEIEEERLEAIPETQTCIKCSSQK